MKIEKNIGLFLFLIFGITILNMCIDSQSVSMARENRGMTPKPQLTLEKVLAGEYAREYESYFNDNFLWRDTFIDWGQKISKLKGIPSDMGIHIQKGANVAQNQRPDGRKLKQDMGQILVIDDKALEINAWNPEASTAYVRGINYLREKTPAQVDFYFLMPPTQIEFLEDESLKSISYSQKESIQFVTQRLAQGIINVNVYDALKEKKHEYIYFRSDHHWTALGAYYAYREFVSATGKTPLGLEEYECVETRGFLGTTYAATLNERVGENPDVVAAYLPNTAYKYEKFYSPNMPVDGVLLDLEVTEDNKYAMFLGGDIPLGKISTPYNDYPKLLIIKDSYANAFIPFLVPHYAEIYFIDPRQYSGSIPQFIKERKIDEVLILNYALINRFEGLGDLLMELTDNKIAW
jgi:hypothetical protein